MFKTALLAGAACLALTSAASATVINFDQSNGGQIANNVVINSIMSADGSVTANVTSQRRENANGGTFFTGETRTFDTTLTQTADSDLEAPFFAPGTTTPLNAVQNNVLIIQENGPTSPNDNGQGGIITFDFLANVFFSGVTFIDDGSLNIAGFLDGTNVFNGVINNGNTENALTALSFASVKVDQIVFNFGSNSGAIDDIMVSAVPLPAGAALMLTGLAGLGFARRRRAQA